MIKATFLTRIARSYSMPSMRMASNVLVVAEISGNEISQGTLATITAAKHIGGGVDVLIAGHNIAEQAKAAAQIDGISKVLAMDDQKLEHKLAENHAHALKGMYI